VITKFVEARSEQGNWGKFMLGWFDRAEWERSSNILDGSLLRTVGWGEGHMLVLDLQTGEGAVMPHGGYAHADLAKHAVWVCPLFEPFLEWLWAQAPVQIDELPDVVLLDHPLETHGYRRPGPKFACMDCGSPDVMAIGWNPTEEELVGQCERCAHSVLVVRR
jgi:hypothetical protein